MQNGSRPGYENLDATPGLMQAALWGGDSFAAPYRNCLEKPRPRKE